MIESIKNNGKFASDLKRIEGIMLRNVRSRHENVEEVLTGMIRKGGKKLRPIFLLLGSAFGTVKSVEAYEAAAAIEMIHMATLIHDDIIDEATLRRGQITAQSKFGKDYAVFMGDFLMNRSVGLLKGKNFIDDVLHGTEKVFYGEMLQYNNRYVRNTSVSTYIRVAANKTASLFALSLYLGAKISCCDPELCYRLRRIGYYFGLSFQIMDDVLDFTANEKSIGKDVQNDIKMGFYTLPIIYTARKDEGVWELIEEEQFEEMTLAIEKSRGLEKTIDLTQKYIIKAKKEISALPDIQEKQILAGLLSQLGNALQIAV
jgi:heptaprenyl diphosphate synthase